MKRFLDGTAARQLDFLDEGAAAATPRARPARRRPSLRLMQKDVYAELARRRRRAQREARRLLDLDQD